MITTTQGTERIDTRAAEIRNRLTAQQAEYRTACAEAAAEGFAPHYCIHGTNLWTDYDPICGACEAGEFTEYTSPAEIATLAREQAESDIAREDEVAAKRTRMVDYFVGIGSPRSRDEWTARIAELSASEVLRYRLD